MQVNALYNQIAADPRHSDVVVLSYEEISERNFANWSMGLVNLEQVNPSLLLKYSETATLDPYGVSGTASMALLHELMARASIIGPSQPFPIGSSPAGRHPAMIRLQETIEVARPIDEVFAYASNFGNIAQWDPGVAAIPQDQSGPSRRRHGVRASGQVRAALDSHDVRRPRVRAAETRGAGGEGRFYPRAG